ncbi:hypothetical protein MNBD_GAMMA04-754 [hydrothermal vent metagenome]|uniref:VWFA domain-containing protein n=1 Tax=hydrothermal vent metagenome TaxID=652676 RepID=A0A3B0WNW4_9ZZZZ
MTLLDTLLNNDLQWRNATWLWALLFPLFLGLIKYLIHTKQQQTYADSYLWPWVSASITTEKQAFKKILPPYQIPLASLFMALAWCCLIIALAGPRSLIYTPNTASREGVDILVSIDLSHSMTATDRYPNRFLFAKSLIESMTKQLEPSDRLALQAFAGQPHIVSPLSEDHSLFQHFINLLEPNLLPLQGSWLERAILEGFNHLNQTGGKSRLLILFTNGAPDFWQAPLLPESLLKKSFFLKQTNPIQLLIVGVGLPSASTLNDPTDAHKIWRVNGQVVQSRLEESHLKKLAQRYGGDYLRADTSHSFMQQLLKAIALPAGERPPQQDRAIWQDYAPPLIAIGFALLLIAFYLLGLFNRIHALKHRRSSHYSLLWMTGLLAISLYSVPQTATAASLKKHTITTLQQADHAYKNGQYETAYQLYTQVTSFQGAFGAGDAAYQLGHIETALFYFRQAAWQATQESDRAKALFNLGNGYYQVALFEYAIQSYQQALLYQPNYDKALHNLSLAQQAKASQPPKNRRKGGGEGNGEGKQGGEGENSDGAFYGGQKPNKSDHSEQGFGSDGDAPEGSKQGNQITLPEPAQSTQYQRSPSTHAIVLNESTNPLNSKGTLILEQQQKQQRAARFKQRIQQLEDNQKALLQRLFEREAGFHAPQERPHPIPGVQPW